MQEITREEAITLWSLLNRATDIEMVKLLWAEIADDEQRLEYVMNNLEEIRRKIEMLVAASGHIEGLLIQYRK